MRYTIAFAVVCGLSSPLFAQVGLPTVDAKSGTVMVPTKVCEINQDQEDTGSRIAKPKKSCKVVMVSAPKGAVLDKASGHVFVPKRTCASSDPATCTTTMVQYVGNSDARHQ